MENNKKHYIIKGFTHDYDSYYDGVVSFLYCSPEQAEKELYKFTGPLIAKSTELSILQRELYRYEEGCSDLYKKIGGEQTLQYVTELMQNRKAEQKKLIDKVVEKYSFLKWGEYSLIELPELNCL